jgi:DNA-binding transcriptional LysR family regulator
MLELRHLRYFIAVAEELNFSRAARRLRMAQPPLSVAIRQLEREVGASLFVRTSREVKLTEAGEAFLDGARRTLAEAEAAVVAAGHAAAGELGSLRLGYSWSARFELLPALGHAFAERSPDVGLVAEEIWNARMPAALRSGQIDAAVAICPEVAGELAYAPVKSERVVVLLSADGRLAADEAISLDALSAETFTIFPRDLAPRLYDFEVGLCRAAGFEPHLANESFHTLWTMGRWDTDAVALVPESVSSDLPAGVVALPLSFPAQRVETSVVWRRDDQRAVVAAFVEVARSLFAAETEASGVRRQGALLPKAGRSGDT